MNSSDSSLKHNPFGELKNFPGKKPLPSPVSSVKGQPKREPAADPENDKNVFLEAVQDVHPIPKDKHAKGAGITKPPENIKNEPETEAMAQLANLVAYGEGFVISNTPEYIEGTGFDVHPEFARRLHRGDFSIQAHIDLHGLGVEEARQTFENFLKESVISGKRAVLIIHGRGLSSPGEPILKNKVSEWLTRGHWRKWVIAYSSAQSYDGGTGATYVLLRQRPITKGARKRQSKK
ncbi:MAG: Smr/MutS family protein [Deltaproteobacteria bacterium]|nr:Smr/MutS family protein [Deltaproteobacteria bacterium]